MTGHLESPPCSPGEGSAVADDGQEPSSQRVIMHTRHPQHMETLHNVDIVSESVNGIESEYALPVPMAPVATPVQVSLINMESNGPSVIHHHHNSVSEHNRINNKIKLETLRSLDQQVTLDMDRHMNQTRNPLNICTSTQSVDSKSETTKSNHGDQNCSNEETPISDDGNESLHEVPENMMHEKIVYTNLNIIGNTPKTWSQIDMDNALDALRNHNMSLTKASATFGIPSTTLWQRAHRLGIDTPKKEGPSKSWSEGNLHNALQALRTGTISANKASKAYGIPSSTLYKIARREGIRLAAPFNAAPTTWRPGDLERALHSIRSGQSSVQRASTEFGIPTGTLYGRCKREGIELSRSNPTPWSEDAMGEALEAVRVGQMSINQAAIHYNLPYSSLYGRFKRCKYEGDINLPVDASSQHVQDPHNSNHMHQQPLLSHHNVHIQDHVSSQDCSQMYSMYDHPIILPSVHNANESNNTINHNNQDCISTS